MEIFLRLRILGKRKMFLSIMWMHKKQGFVFLRISYEESWQYINVKTNTKNLNSRKKFQLQRIDEYSGAVIFSSMLLFKSMINGGQQAK